MTIQEFKEKFDRVYNELSLRDRTKGIVYINNTLTGDDYDIDDIVYEENFSQLVITV